MTNTQKALAQIHTFADGSTKLAESLPAPDYIQHNLPYGTGRAALISSVSDLASAPVKTTVKNIRAFEDGDKVFLHRRDIRRAPTAYYDLWRVENGRIAGHRDIIETIADPSAWKNQNGKF